MNVSESSLKRWFSTRNLSLARLDHICQIAGITVQELTQSSSTYNGPEFFTHEQEQVMNDEKCFVVFYIAALGRDFSAILKGFCFTEHELIQILSKLEQVNLLELHPNNKIVPKASPSTMWIPQGVLSKKYFKEVRADFMDSFFDQPRETQVFFTGRLSQEGAKLIRKKIAKLSEEIREYYILDAGDQNADNTTIFLGMRPWSFSIINQYRK
jgi:hypothetical protein